MHICLDIDDTITYLPDFFVKICESFSHARITIVTFRTEFESTSKYLNGIGIRYDQLIVSTDVANGKKLDETLHEWKARCVNQLQPEIFFEDMPEVVSLIDDKIAVFMPCDQIIRSWIKSSLSKPKNAT